jgi:hypothetical protein
VASDLPAWTGSVDVSALAYLIGLHSEQDWLDYKRQCDLSSAPAMVELAKDAGAMMITGGYILVGADDRGEPSGDVDHLELFDTAVLHDKLAKYLPVPFEIRSTAHRFEGQSYALLYVAPHPDGFCVFKRDGTYQDGGREKTAFRTGEVFARHGTRSERWTQDDIRMIKRRLRADADRSRDQQAEALSLLHGVPGRLGGAGLWLAMSVVPQYLVTGAPVTIPDAAQQFLRDWQVAQAPIQGFSLSDAVYRQVGSVVIQDPAGGRAQPHWWRLALHDAGQAVGAHVLAHQVAANPATGDMAWLGLPQSVTDGTTIPVRRDEIEIYLLTLLDLLTAYSAHVSAGGTVQVTAMLITPGKSDWTHVAVLEELTDDNGNQEGWRLATARARQPLDDVVSEPVTHTVQLAGMRDPQTRMRGAHHLATDLLAVLGIDQPSMLTAEGGLDPYGAASDRDQMAYQHARHLGLPVSPVGPMEQRQRFEEEMRLAREKLRRR